MPLSKVQPTAKFSKKYIVQAGFVVDDRQQRQFVSTSAVMKLYGVPPIECVVLRDDFMPQPGRTPLGLEGLKVLAPRQDGIYRKPDGSPNA
jgi:hypothetical protein